MYRFIIAFVLCLILVGCTRPIDTSSEPIKILKGISLSPAAYDNQNILNFFTKVSDGADLVSWQGDWQELHKSNGGPYIILNSASTYGYIPIVVVGVFNQDTGELLRPLDVATQNTYVQDIQRLAQEFKPKYLGIGIEINILYEHSQADFDTFVSLFETADIAVKQVSPATKVFTVFQLEHLKGLRGGLFGGQNDASQAQWQLLARFDKADILAFSTYPAIIYSTPADIPEDYFTEIQQYTSKPIAITENGWFREAPAGWQPSTVETQAEYINRFFKLLPDPKPEFVFWSFLYDPPIASPVFSTMGLLQAGQQTSPAWEAWKLAK